jgi:WbqC-like protein family
MKSLAIMQPYFFPYIGYFQLINAVNLFIVYDNIKYTKKGWINRNRILKNGKDVVFSVPLKKDSDFLDIRNREISPTFRKDKLLNQIRETYRRSPYFERTFSLVERIVLEKETNLFKFILNSIREICACLAIRTEIVVSSSVQIDHSLSGKAKVVALCKHVGADVYINAVGGQDLYSKEEFSANGISLKFLRTNSFEYKQFDREFVPWLSIVDVMMFNAPDEIRECLDSKYELI